MTPYADTAYAYAYFCDRLRTKAFDDATIMERAKALKEATLLIDVLNFAGDKTDSAQEREFPRGGDTVIPKAIKDACCEIAIMLLDDVDPQLEAETLGNLRSGIGDAQVVKDPSAPNDHIRAGIPSLRAWNLLLPFLRDPGNVSVSRAS
jgi:hypothetical protein